MKNDKKRSSAQKLEMAFFSSLVFVGFCFFQLSIHSHLSDFFTLLLIISISSVFSVFALVLMSRFLKYYLALSHTPISKIRSAAQGYIGMKGRAKPIAVALQTPISKQDCVWYKYEIARKVYFKGICYWEPTSTKETEDGFYIDDDTGVCALMAQGAEVYASSDLTWYGNSKEAINLSHSSWYKTKRFRFREQALLCDQPLYLAGMFRTLRHDSILEIPVLEDSNSFKQKAIQQLMQEWIRDYQSLLERFDTNQDGKLDRKEWQKALQTTEEDIRKKYGLSSQQVPENSIHVLSQYGLPDYKPFMILSLGFKEVASRYFGKIFLYSAICLAFLKLGLYFNTGPCRITTTNHWASSPAKKMMAYPIDIKQFHLSAMIWAHSCHFRNSSAFNLR